MSERATGIAEFTVMNKDSRQAISMTQKGDLSERMTDGWRIGCPIRWRICRRVSNISAIFKRRVNRRNRLKIYN
jgi:hypothetical protein